MEPQAECWVKWEIYPSPVGATPVPLVPPAKPAQVHKSGIPRTPLRFVLG